MNYPVALAGAFTALEALNRAKSIGQFVYGDPVYEKMAKLETDIQNLIQLVLSEAKNAGVNL